MGIDGARCNLLSCLLRQLRDRQNATPVLLLSARGEVNERVEGLNAGADDYLPKPFVIAELIARVRALGRRGSESKPPLGSHVGLCCQYPPRSRGTRERRRWKAFIGTGAYNQDVAACFTRWLITLGDSQRLDGAYTDVSPCGGGISAGWSDARIICPWTLWRMK